MRPERVCNGVDNEPVVNASCDLHLIALGVCTPVGFYVSLRQAYRSLNLDIVGL